VKIGPRVVALDTRHNTIWYRQIGGARLRFIHVKVTILERPYVAVTDADTGELVRCTCPRSDCPSRNH
jgi:hypothetical protein